MVDRETPNITLAWPTCAQSSLLSFMRVIHARGDGKEEGAGERRHFTLFRLPIIPRAPFSHAFLTFSSSHKRRDRQERGVETCQLA